MSWNENAQKWVDALRGGEFPQGMNSLHEVDGGYCCLGVACELYRKDTGKGKWIKPVAKCEDHRLMFSVNGEGSTTILPPEVRRWLNMKTSSGSLRIDAGDEEGFVGSTLADANDHGFEFPRIADLIERYKEDLFIVDPK